MPEPVEYSLRREDLLREEALIRAREVCTHSREQDPSATKIVGYAEEFFRFLKGDA